MTATYALCAAVAVVFSVACQPKVTYREPPANTYQAATFDVRIGETTAHVKGASVTAEFFRAAGAQPLLGRFFVEGETGPPASSVAILGRDFWQERFAASPAVIGQTIDVDGRKRTVVGIAPPGFSLPGGAQLWVPRP